MRSYRDQHGVALPLVLIVLVVLTGFLIVFLSLGSTESLIGRSHNEVTLARYLAEAGIEWAYDSLAGSANWNPALLGPDGLMNTADDGKFATSMSLPGLSAAFGTFSVTVRNDAQPGDPQITGVAVDPGGAFNDTNDRVIVTSVGLVGTAKRTIRVVLRRNLPPLVAALALPGTESETRFNGNAFRVNGNDTNLNDSPGPGSPVWGIAVGAGNVHYESEVQETLSGGQKDRVLGKKQNAALPEAYGDNTIAPDPALTSSAITDFVTQVKVRAHVTLESIQSEPLSYANIGADCASNWSSPTCWGTQAKPKLVYIKAGLDPNSTFSALQVSGTSTGAGILIVEDGDITIDGNFRWDGIIIVTGQWVGFNLGGGSNVYGAVISNETASDPEDAEALVIGGSTRVNYSSEAIALARQLRGTVALTSWQEI